ncbi:hypothetical protein DC498_17740 [Terrimonas sp.]|uniref:hypothetical protein n=1 Tax=Terrimonas sp. TaxID=1914338 RepID=UPI000D51F858|nr:hypothetical protein [Terrimonas sp.]PVD50815.1 hypothetical protein DC498_17740 [Terrimonas sp.]
MDKKKLIQYYEHLTANLDLANRHLKLAQEAADNFRKYLEMDEMDEKKEKALAKKKEKAERFNKYLADFDAAWAKRKRQNKGKG